MRYLWRKFQFHCFFSCLLALFFSQICSVERLKAFLLFLIFLFFYYVVYIHFFFISLPVFPFFQFCFWHLAVTNNTFHWIFSFTCSVFLIFLISPFPSPPPYLLLTLAVPGNVTLVKIHFSHSLSPFFFSRSLTCFLHTPKFLSMILIN